MASSSTMMTCASAMADSNLPGRCVACRGAGLPERWGCRAGTVILSARIGRRSARLHVPFRELSPSALDAVIEEFVTREGTEYGHADWSLARKVAQVRAQLERGDAWLDYDPASGSVTVRPASERPG